jgi:hypothetical protein
VTSSAPPRSSASPSIACAGLRIVSAERSVTSGSPRRISASSPMLASSPRIASDLFAEELCERPASSTGSRSRSAKLQRASVASPIDAADLRSQAASLQSDPEGRKRGCWSSWTMAAGRRSEPAEPQRRSEDSHRRAEGPRPDSVDLQREGAGATSDSEDSRGRDAGSSSRPVGLRRYFLQEVA